MRDRQSESAPGMQFGGGSFSSSSCRNDGSRL
jgi:hypothetical protein